MSRSGSARASLGVITLLVLVACGSGTAAPPTSAPSGAPGPTASAAEVTATATPKPPKPLPVASNGPTTYDTSKLGALFDLPMIVELPPHWKPLLPPTYNPAGAIGFVHTGEPPTDESQWWDFGFMLVDGASVLDPKEIADPRGHTKLPWPKSYIDYLVGLPGVKVVAAPEPVTVLGVPGRRVVVTTPAMHPTIYLAGDTMWMGGGATGIDPAFERQVIEFTVNGKKVISEHVDDPARFDENIAVVNSIMASISVKP